MKIKMIFVCILLWCLCLPLFAKKGKKGDKDILKGDCFYQRISNNDIPGSIVGNAPYFLSGYICATDSTRLGDDLIIQLQEWDKTNKLLAAHTWNVDKDFLTVNAGKWMRVGSGRFDDLMDFTSSNDPKLDSFTIEFGFDKAAGKGDAFLLDGVQLEQASRLPSGNLTAAPLAFATEKGVSSPNESYGMGLGSPYYTW